MSLTTKMQATARNDKVKAQALKARGQARQQAGKAAAQVGPLARGAKVTAKRLESSGQTLESRVAPKVSAMMSSAAKRIDPSLPKRRRWPLVLGGLAVLAAAAGAIFGRRASAAPWRNAEPQEETATAETEASANANSSGKPKVRTS